MHLVAAMAPRVPVMHPEAPYCSLMRACCSGILIQSVKLMQHARQRCSCRHNCHAMDCKLHTCRMRTPFHKRRLAGYVLAVRRLLMNIRDEALWSIKVHMTRVVPHMKVREVVADPLGLIPPAQSPRPCSAQATLINGTIVGTAPDNVHVVHCLMRQ